MQLKSLLCPVDFSPASLRAFDYSIRLAKNYDARLHLLHVIAPVLPIAYEQYFDATNVIASLRTKMESELKSLRKVAADAGVKTDATIRMGDVRAEISEYVKTHRIDMVVMGKHGVSGIERWFLGSVTERLLRHLPVPILIIGEGKAKKAVPPAIKRVVMTTDFSGGAKDAISYALSVADDAKATVTFLHVMPFTIPGVGIPYEKPVNEVQAELERIIPEKSRMSGRVATKVKSGVPYEEILKFVDKTRPDLLIMNIHGKGMLDRALLGSTAERVIRGASCTVLAVPPEKAQRRPKTRRAA